MIFNQKVGPTGSFKASATNVNLTTNTASGYRGYSPTKTKWKNVPMNQNFTNLSG